MSKVLATAARFVYDRRTMRYRDRRTGQLVKTRVVKAATTRVITASQNEMGRLADDMAARRIKLSEWQDRTAAEIKNLHVSLAMAGAGGMAQMTPRDYGRVGRRLRFEYDRLARLAGQIKNRELTAGQIKARVNMFISAGHTTHEAARFDNATDEGFGYESNVLGKTDHHCTTKTRPGCVEQTRAGRVPIGTLTPVGERSCLSNCDCSIRYHRKPTRS